MITLKILFGDDLGPENVASLETRLEKLWNTLLDDRERLIVDSRIQTPPVSYAKLAKQWQISPCRVRQLHLAALRHLRLRLHSADIADLPLRRSIIIRLTYRFKSIAELLREEPSGISISYRAQVIAVLVEKGYTEKDGPLLSQSAFADLMQSVTEYRKIILMRQKGKLTRVFCNWFNEAIRGREFEPHKKSKIRVVPL